MSEGIKFDQNKTRYDLLAPDALEAIAQVFTYGAVKYALASLARAERNRPRRSRKSALFLFRQE